MKVKRVDEEQTSFCQFSCTNFQHRTGRKMRSKSVPTGTTMNRGCVNTYVAVIIWLKLWFNCTLMDRKERFSTHHLKMIAIAATTSSALPTSCSRNGQMTKECHFSQRACLPGWWYASHWKNGTCKILTDSEGWIHLTGERVLVCKNLNVG